MGIIRNRLTRRFGLLGLLSDVALVGTAVSRMIQRRDGAATSAMSITEIALASGAVLRLLQRLRRRGKTR